MKKNIIKISLVALTTFVSLTSCDRNLDQISSINEDQDQSMTRAESFRQALDGAYTAFKGSGYYNGDTGSQLIMGDLTTDNLVRTASGRNTNFAASNFEFSSDNSQTTGLYSAAYLAISRTNFVLSYINNGVLSGTQKTNIEAEARGLRAIAHFDIVRAYSQIPTQSAEAKNKIGIYYSEKYSPLNNTASRNLTVEQVYDKIIADLLFAADNITQNDADKGRLNKSAIYGLLSRVNLYKGDYANTIKYGELALGLSPSITAIDNFTRIWKENEGLSRITDGVLFQLSNAAAEPNNTVGAAYNQSVPSLRSEFVVDYDLYTAYAANDIRKTAYFTTSVYSKEKYNHVTKYAGNGGPANVVPIKYLRSAEVLLNVAEAHYKTGNPAQALTLLDKLRKERYSSFTPGTESGQAILDAILKERRLELAFENDRWYTLKRLGLSVQRSGKGDLFDGTGTPAVKQTLAAGSSKWQWPIPITAIQANPNIKQNDDY
ncbi:RagB/SusD family nutrient uptake outer membrane protein [Chryseobacterium indologenes]|uniref:RagB/SusD family nutrient uptake outer membrane protein n=1 Tax=Chryseobacterium indologenes TaxID=253 RepID=UPI000BFCD264|nr:RagB/SusD family nutrient uptake outer membrane protein [Chryseobacterium indologenes]ATN06117.1 RagB/SusD family nutrient uptake outer membrane protein [Chryseobacterium indologenes]AYY85123.1 RagB/SusD family nutrient uptake outer membrane protein [Chryseobacterium indologenes]QIX82009.1 RagB/SusD family nutrient uptake outer membrane protein [Chryseobacterium indologenes]UDQ55788.1 RagB/SusD family nutrient uptake outer membrane protein [Chryseobacterium indologenes]